MLVRTSISHRFVCGTIKIDTHPLNPDNRRIRLKASQVTPPPTSSLLQQQQLRGYRTASNNNLYNLGRRLPNDLHIRQAHVTDHTALYQLYRSVTMNKTSALGLCPHEVTPQYVRELIERQWRAYSPESQNENRDALLHNQQPLFLQTQSNQSCQHAVATVSSPPPTHGLVHVLERRSKNQLIGIIAASKRQTCVWSHVLCDLTIAIDPSHQQKGLGHAMLFSFLHCVRQSRPDIARVELSVFASHQHAIRLYRRHGFICEGVRRLQLVNHNQTGQLEDVEEYAWLNPNFDPTTSSHITLPHTARVASYSFSSSKRREHVPPPSSLMTQHIPFTTYRPRHVTSE